MTSSRRLWILKRIQWILKWVNLGHARTRSFWFVSWYATHEKAPDLVQVVGERTEDVSWASLRRRVNELNLPSGVRLDALPIEHPFLQDIRVVYRDVFAVGIHPTAFGMDGRLTQSIRQRSIKPFANGHLRLSDLIALESGMRDNREKLKVLNRAIILDDRHGHFGHWLFEQLPQLRMLADIEDLHVIYNGHDAWKRELLEAFGVSGDRLIPYDGHTQFQIGELYSTNGGRLSPVDLAWLKKKLFEVYPQTVKGPRRVFVSRQGVGARHIFNWEEIQGVLKEFDFQVVQPEDLRLVGSLSAFADAEIIMGPEGSGLRNMAWSKRPKVIEIFGHELNFGQWRMAHALGLDYEPYLENRPVPKTDVRWRDVDVKGISVNPDQLRQFLSRHLGE